jgi:hypothetical protein
VKVDTPHSDPARGGAFSQSGAKEKEFQMRRIISFILAASLLFAPSVALAQNTSNPTSSDFVRIVRVDANGNGTQGAVSVTKVFEGVGIGYYTGAAFTQGTSRTTGVTINAYAGAITLFSAAGSATAASFTVTDSRSERPTRSCLA